MGLMLHSEIAAEKNRRKQELVDDIHNASTHVNHVTRTSMKDRAAPMAAVLDALAKDYENSKTI